MFPYHTDLHCTHDPQFAQNRMRILVIGSPKVGKTSLIRRMVDNVFVENSEKPDKFEHSRLTAMARAIEGQLYKLEFQEILQSFRLVKPRRQQKRRGSTGRSRDCNICLVGAKADCKRDRQVPYSKAEQDAELRDMSLMEVSSKDGTNISVLFDEIVEYTMERREAQEEFQRTHEMGYLSDQEEVYPKNETIQLPVDEPARPNLFCFWPFGRT